VAPVTKRLAGISGQTFTSMTGSLTRRARTRQGTKRSGRSRDKEATVTHADDVLARFATTFVPDEATGFPGWGSSDTLELLGRDVPDYTRFMAAYGRPSFDAGLLRFVGNRGLSASEWNGADGWRQMWPGRSRMVVFAYDWLGRQYALDTARRDGDEPLVTLLDPADGAALESDFTFLAFIEGLCGELGVSLLSKELHAAWRRIGGRAPGVRECVCFKHPLRLGGKQSVANMELGDMAVHLVFMKQIHARIAEAQAKGR
jgi:hypothetical protein